MFLKKYLFLYSPVFNLLMRAGAQQVDEVDLLANEALQKLLSHPGNENLSAAFNCSNHTGDCGPNVPTLGIRREWGALSKTERRSYIDAVLCLQSKPSITPSAEVPGAKTRYDDFVATHINQTLFIHGTANFLSWHRYFVWTYEKALREECGYDGYQPYWSWGKYSENPHASPIFDGSDYSMGGDGVYEDLGNASSSLPVAPVFRIPPGNAGGCVSKGPFANMTVNLGPVLLYGFFSGRNGFDYNPRCLKRSISTFISRTWTRSSQVLSLIRDYSDIASFQFTMQGRPDQGFLGVHGGGHFTIGGDPGGDFFVSPGEPVFWLHHAMIDRAWWIWQNLELDKRETQIAGTRTMWNLPPSPPATLDDLINLGYNAPPRRIRELMSTTKSPLWYVYL